jgi:DNA-3-methyladenine glycosylase II
VPITAEMRRLARKHLQACDPVMREMTEVVGPFTLKTGRDRFWMLVRSIISQQISVAAARSIRRRLEESIAPARVTPEALLELSADQLRSVGLSPQKTTYIRDLASRVNDGTLRLRTIGRMSDEEIIEHLIQVKGIGRWTAQMFLIFALGRLDVFPVDDLGIRVAIRSRYGLEQLPDRATALEIARPWSPYASVASWYCWRSMDLGRNESSFATGYPS